VPTIKLVMELWYLPQSNPTYDSTKDNHPVEEENSL